MSEAKKNVDVVAKFAPLTKEQLIRFGVSTDVKLVKSWNKTQMIEALIAGNDEENLLDPSWFSGEY